MTSIAAATSPEQLDAVRHLMRAFVAWHRDRHRENISLIDRYFDASAFEAELADLPGQYAPPGGRLLLATHLGRPAGCVALRALAGGACEMKRMFIYPEFHRNGIGQALAEAVIREATTIGYRVMRLDTSVRQHEAQRLYQRVGFRAGAPYYDLPPDMKQWLVFMELELPPTGGL
jgi:GNAT superfamily N-acetyltransferase